MNKLIPALCLCLALPLTACAAPPESGAGGAIPSGQPDDAGIIAPPTTVPPPAPKNTPETAPETADVPTNNISAKYMECLHYEERGFYKAIEQAAPYQTEGKIIAAASPHFLPVMHYTANILATLAAAEQPPSTIYLIAPNHSGEGLPIIVADRGWSTPFGNLDADAEATAALLNAPLLADKLGVDLGQLQKDHSAATLAPFIKYYLPQAQVVTILLNRSCALEDLQTIAGLIHEASRAKPVFILGSVDFSHYLDINETPRRDEITEGLIKNGDIRAIKRLDSGYMDAPEVIITMINYATLQSARAELKEKVILPESDLNPNVAYSYGVYLFSSE